MKVAEFKTTAGNFKVQLDDDEYVVMTLWDNRKDFDTWTDSSDFKESHSMAMPQVIDYCDIRGFSKIKIMVSGGLKKEQIQELKDAGVDVISAVSLP